MNSRCIVIYSPHRTPSLIVEAIARHSYCEVECCSTPEQTIDTTLALRPSLVILLDICPIINGTGFIRQLRSIGNRASAQSNGQRPAILVIAWQQAEQTVLSLLEEGVDQYMTFPICVNRLHSKILSLLNNTLQ